LSSAIALILILARVFLASEDLELLVAVDRIGTRAALRTELGGYAEELRTGTTRIAKPEAERSNNDLTRDALPNTAHLGVLFSAQNTYVYGDMLIGC
jgi:hypothetical protein